MGIMTMKAPISAYRDLQLHVERDQMHQSHVQAVMIDYRIDLASDILTGSPRLPTSTARRKKRSGARQSAQGGESGAMARDTRSSAADRHPVSLLSRNPPLPTCTYLLLLLLRPERRSTHVVPRASHAPPLRFLRPSFSVLTVSIPRAGLYKDFIA